MAGRADRRDRIATLGRVLAAAFGLVGLFGVDLVLRDATPWPVEVNPRYTASVEVLELALGRSLLTEHLAACAPLEAIDAIAPPAPGATGNVVGKSIVFAPRECRFPESIDWSPIPIPILSAFDVPDVADVPDPGTAFVAGEPVLTVFAHGASIEVCEERLQERRARWESLLTLPS